MRREIYFLIAFIAFGFTAFGQHENTLYNINNITQSAYLNPALAPNYKVSIGLPGISSNYFAFANTGFAYKDIFKRKDDNSVWINLNDFYAQLKPKNHTKIMVNSDLFSLGISAGPRMHITFNFTEKVNARLMLPKGILWAIEGNAPEIAGNTIQMGPRFDAMHYREFGIGTSYVVNKKLTLGGRIKLLYGKSNVHTEQSDWTLTTASEAYQLTLKGNTLINTSGVNQYANDDQDFEAKDYLLNKQNKGFAIDLGGTYKLMDRLTLTASIVDLGSIKWKDDVKNYQLNNASYTFNGFSLKDDNDFKNIEDTLDAKFKFKESSSSYKTSLPTRFYLGGNYLLFRNCYAGLLMFGEVYQKTFSPSFSASLTKDFGRALSLSLSYTAANRWAKQIGAGLVIKAKPVQFYFVSDNIIGAALMPKTAKEFTARLGINLVFGRKPTEDKQTYK